MGRFGADFCMDKDEFIYHIMVDRFTGDPSLKNENRFLGGTLRGISEHLDHIQRIGATALLLTPVCASANYHGYHTTDYLDVDPHFGTLADLQNLIADVHSRGMKIYADFVPNHCHFTHPFFLEAKENVDSPYRPWFYWQKAGYKTFLDVAELPKLNLNYSPACQYMIDVARYWCGLGFDGLRIDHAIGPSFRFWKRFMKEMKRVFPEKIFFGEVWGAGLQKRYYPTIHLKHEWWKRLLGFSQEDLQRDYVGVLDGVLDFEYRNILIDAIWHGKKLEGNRVLEKKIRHHFSLYPSDFKLILFLDNHDMDRLLYCCHGNVELMRKAIAFSRKWGKPFILYYGTEFGMQNHQTVFDGSPYADLRVRECVDWNKKPLSLTDRHEDI